MSGVPFSCADLAVFVNPKGKATTILVLGAYFDESGTHENPVIFSVAGYLFSCKRVRRFEQEWSKILRDFGVSAYHAVALENRTQNSEFERWSDNTCSRFVLQLISIINRYAVLGVGAVVDAAAYQMEFGAQLPGPNSAFKRLVADNAYLISLKECLRLMAQHCDKLGYPADEKIICICDERYLKGTIVDAYNEIRAGLPSWGNRLGGLTFASDVDAIPLQAADLLAYVTRRGSKERLEGMRKLRPAYGKLRKNLHRIGGLNRAGAAELKRRLDVILHEKEE